MSTGRHIPLSASPNLRDIGGYATGTGQRVREGVVYRSGDLARLDANDLETIEKLGLRCVVDFRTPLEIRSTGQDQLPEGLTAVSLPVGGGTMERFYALASGDGQLNELVLADGKAELAMLNLARGFVADSEERAHFAQVLRWIASEERVPLLYHCTAGKDRTGWMTAVLLRILGVSSEDIMRNYLASNEYFRPFAMKQLSLLDGMGVNPDLVKPLLEQSPSYLEASFDEADARFGSFDNYLSQGLELDVDVLKHLRRHLLTSE